MRFSRRRSAPVFALIVLLILSALTSAVGATPVAQAPVPTTANGGAPDSGGGADAGGQDGQGFRAGASGLIFFASDGLVQNRVAGYVQQGALPTFGRLLKTGAYATDNGLLTQAPPNTGAGWYSLATGAWPGVTGSTNNTFHINGAPFAQPHRGLRRGRAAGGDDRAGGRARRQEGRPDRVGGRPRRQPSTDRPSTSATSSPAAAWPPTTSAPTTIAAFVASFGLQFDHPGGLCRAGALSRRGARRRERLDQCAGLVQPGQGNAPARARFRRRQVRAQRVHLRLDERQHDQLRPGAVLADEGRRRRGGDAGAGASGPT